jgi:hypothetical protein
VLIRHTGHSALRAMRDWIDKLSFRARVAILISIWAAVIFAIAEIDLTVVSRLPPARHGNDVRPAAPFRGAALSHQCRLTPNILAAVARPPSFMAAVA